MSRPRPKQLRERKFPKRIYVTLDLGPDPVEFLCWPTLEDLDDDSTVAVYELVEVKTLTITKELK